MGNPVEFDGIANGPSIMGPLPVYTVHPTPLNGLGGLYRKRSRGEGEYYRVATLQEFRLWSESTRYRCINDTLCILSPFRASSISVVGPEV